MDELFKAELVDRISDLIFSSITIGTVMQRDSLQELTSDMEIKLNEGISNIDKLFIELTNSRDEYQKAADTMAMEHKVEREKLIDDFTHHKISAVRNANLALKYYGQLRTANLEIESLKLQLKENNA